MYEVVGFDECFTTSTLLQLININTTLTVNATSSENKSINKPTTVEKSFGSFCHYYLPMGDIAGNLIPTFTIKPESLFYHKTSFFVIV